MQDKCMIIIDHL